MARSYRGGSRSRRSYSASPRKARRGSVSRRRRASSRASGGTIRLVIEQPSQARLEAPPGMTTRAPRKATF